MGKGFISSPKCSDWLQYRLKILLKKDRCFAPVGAPVMCMKMTTQPQLHHQFHHTIIWRAHEKSVFIGCFMGSLNLKSGYVPFLLSYGCSILSSDVILNHLKL